MMHVEICMVMDSSLFCPSLLGHSGALYLCSAPSLCSGLSGPLTLLQPREHPGIPRSPTTTEGQRGGFLGESPPCILHLLCAGGREPFVLQKMLTLARDCPNQNWLDPTCSSLALNRVTPYPQEMLREPSRTACFTNQ